MPRSGRRQMDTLLRTTAIATAVALLGVSCSSSREDSSGVALRVSAQKGAAVRLGDVVVTIPAGAVSRDDTVHVERMSAPATEAPLKVSTPVVSVRLDHARSVKPIAITLPVRTQDASTVLGALYDARSKSWQSVTY